MKTFYTYFKSIRSCAAAMLFLMASVDSDAQTVSTFDELSLDAESYWDGSDHSGGFNSGIAHFYNSYNTQFGYWSQGFAYSNTTDVVTGDYTNPSSAIAGKGFKESANYAVGFGNSSVKLNAGQQGMIVNGLFVTNTTYGAFSMKNGDMFAKAFGGPTGNDEDWFKLTIDGYLNGTKKSTSVDFYLADFRFSENSQDYIVTNWKWADLKSLGNIDSLVFSLSSSDVGEWGMNTPAYFAIDNFNDPLFAPAAGVAGTTAMFKDSSAFLGWATSCVVVRGPQDISDPSIGLTTVGDPSMATGQPGSGVVSLGDRGSATLSFSTPIANGSGPDFAVFENGFSTASGPFLELAYVEVSSDGSRFVRFPSASFTDETVQKWNGDVLDATKLHNLAGKYVANYGTPFDLDELKDSVGLEVNHITHIRVIDVVGSINPLYARYDSYGNKINDPWTTAFASGGFDLDAVGVIHTDISTGVKSAFTSDGLAVYPNPVQVNEEFTLTTSLVIEGQKVQIYNFSGILIKEVEADAQSLKISSEGMDAGIYVVKLQVDEQVMTHKLVIR